LSWEVHFLKLKWITCKEPAKGGLKRAGTY
jgi:hypothetical protein